MEVELQLFLNIGDRWKWVLLGTDKLRCGRKLKNAVRLYNPGFNFRPPCPLPQLVNNKLSLPNISKLHTRTTLLLRKTLPVFIEQEAGCAHENWGREKSIFVGNRTIFSCRPVRSLVTTLTELTCSQSWPRFCLIIPVHSGLSKLNCNMRIENVVSSRSVYRKQQINHNRAKPIPVFFICHHLIYK